MLKAVAACQWLHFESTNPYAFMLMLRLTPEKFYRTMWSVTCGVPMRRLVTTRLRPVKDSIKYQRINASIPETLTLRSGASAT